MDVKISGKIWTDPELEDQPYSVKLTAFWLLTNPRVTLFGYTEVSKKRFQFETDLEYEALHNTIEALPKAFIRACQGVWARNFIRYQIGDGERLVKNNITQSLLKQLYNFRQTDMAELVLAEYPAIRPAFGTYCAGRPEPGLSLPGLNPSPCQALAKGKGEREREREGGGGGNSARASQNQTFLDRVGAIFGGKKNRAASYLELNAVGAMSELPAEGEIAIVEAFYRVPIDDQGNPRRPESRESLVTNWVKTVDRAETWRREKGLIAIEKKLGPVPWPPGAEEWYAATFPKADRPQDWHEVDERIRQQFERRTAA